jgi:hypothetical protein
MSNLLARRTFLANFGLSLGGAALASMNLPKWSLNAAGAPANDEAWQGVVNPLRLF